MKGRAAIAIALTVPVLVACSTPAAAPPPTGAGGLSVSSPDFADGGPLPKASGYRNGNVSPTIVWAGVPPATTALALVCRDSDADGFVHWVLVNVDPRPGAIPQGQAPSGAIEGSNGFGTVGWGGPAPPSGTHHYRFTLYALRGRLSVQPGVEAATVERLVRGSTTGSAVMTGTYGAGG